MGFCSIRGVFILLIFTRFLSRAMELGFRFVAGRFLLCGLVFPGRLGVGGVGHHQDSGSGSREGREAVMYRHDLLIRATDR